MRRAVGDRGGVVRVRTRAFAIGMAAIRAERDERPTQFRRRLPLRLDAFPRDLAVARRMSRVAAPFALGGVRRVAVVVLAFPDPEAQIKKGHRKTSTG